jgi:hypothetical protein
MELARAISRGRGIGVALAIRHLDRLGHTATADLRELVIARGSTLLDLHGIGPSGAARLLADVGDIHRFANRDRFASWNGTAPLDASSGGQQRHRLSRAGNRRINRTLHIMGVVQLRNPTAGRVYFDGKKAAGKTPMEAMRALKRRLSNVVYARMLVDQQRSRSTSPGDRHVRACGLNYRSAAEECRPVRSFSGRRQNVLLQWTLLDSAPLCHPGVDTLGEGGSCWAHGKSTPG